MAELADALDSGSNGRKAVQVQVLLPAPKKSYHFDTTFFIHYGVMVYHHATCLRAYHQKERFLSLFFAYHHTSACIKPRNDDIQCSALMIFSRFVSNDIHFLRKVIKVTSLFAFSSKIQIVQFIPLSFI